MKTIDIPKKLARQALRDAADQIEAKHRAGVFDEGDPNHPKRNGGVNYATGKVVTVVWPAVGGSVGSRDPAPELSPARYSKGNVAVRTQSPDGYKTRAARLADHLRGRYSNREHAYIMSPSKAKKLKTLFEAGRDASFFSGALLTSGDMS